MKPLHGHLNDRMMFKAVKKESDKVNVTDVIIQTVVERRNSQKKITQEHEAAR
jgi:hypothetical protein